MKKIILSLMFALIGLYSIAQVQTLPNSIGIGTGINSSIPFHINKNGEVARFQGTWPYVTFYDGLNLSGYVQAINSTFEIGSKSNFDLNFFTGDTQRLKIFGDGTGITAYSRFNMGAGMNLVGAMRMAGNTGALGDVLMSLGNGTPVWSSISQNPQIGFRAYNLSAFTIPHNTETTITFINESFDDGGGLASNTGVFTAPSAGVYNFIVKLSIGITNPSIPNINGVLRLYLNNSLHENFSQTLSTNNSYANRFESSTVLKLAQNDTVYFSFFQVNPQLQAIAFDPNSIISGFKVY